MYAVSLTESPAWLSDLATSLENLCQCGNDRIDSRSIVHWFRRYHRERERATGYCELYNVKLLILEVGVNTSLTNHSSVDIATREVQQTLIAGVLLCMDCEKDMANISTSK